MLNAREGVGSLNHHAFAARCVKNITLLQSESKLCARHLTIICQRRLEEPPFHLRGTVSLGRTNNLSRSPCLTGSLEKYNGRSFSQLQIRSARYSLQWCPASECIFKTSTAAGFSD
jgi:hypothetical protein